VFDKSGWFGSKERTDIKNKNLKKGGDDEIAQLLLFSVGTSAYAIEVRYLRRIVKNLEIVHLPNEPDFIPGVIHLHFGVAKVIDIRKIIPLDIPLRTDTRIVIFAPHTNDSAYYGLLVDEVIGFAELPHERVTNMVSTARYINNNFMLGWFTMGIQEFKKEVSRRATEGEDRVTWINCEEMTSAIINSGDSEDIVFRLTALFNPDYLLSDEYQQLLHSKQNKRINSWE